MAADARFQDEKGLVSVVNEMLEQLHVQHRVEHWSQIGSEIFVTLFEGFCGEQLQNVIRDAKTKEDQLHNMKLVISTLSADVLNTSMSHIPSEDIVDGDMMAISNLLEVFSGLMEYILDKIGSDTGSTDNEADEHILDNDPDMLTSELIDDILEQELGRGYKDITDSGPESFHNESDKTRRRRDVQTHNRRLKDNSGARPSKETGDTTADLVALGIDSYEDMSNHSADNTESLIALGDSRYMRNDTKKTSQYSGKANGKGMDRNLSGHSSRELLDDAQRARMEGSYTDRAKMEGGYTERARMEGGYTERARMEGGYTDHARMEGGYTERARMEGGYAERARMEGGYIERARMEGGYTEQARSYGSHVATVSPSKTTSSVLDHSAASVSLPQQPLSSQSGQVSYMPGSTIPSYSRGAYPASQPTDDISYPRYQQGVALPTASTAPYQRDPPAAPVTRGTRPGHQDPLSASLPADSRPYQHTEPPTGAFPAQSNLLPAGSGRPHTSTYPSAGVAVSGRTGFSHRLASTAPPQSRREVIDQNLEHLVENTVEMTRKAVRTSPLRRGVTADHYWSSERSGGPIPGSGVIGGADHRLRGSDDGTQGTESVDEELSQALRTTLKKVHKETEEVDSLSAKHRQVDEMKQSNLRPSNGASAEDKKRDKRKVSFLTSRSLSDMSTSDSSRELTNRSHSNTTRRKEPVDSESRHYDWAEPRTSPLRPKNSKIRTAGLVADEVAPRQQLNGHESPPKSFRDYLDKYYGLVERRDLVFSDDELSQHSDSAVDYVEERHALRPEDNSQDGDADISEVEAEIRRFRSRLKPGKEKAVRFEDILDDSAPGDMGPLRRKLRDEGQRSRRKAEVLDKIYQRELEDFGEDADEAMRKVRRDAKTKETEYKKKVLRNPKTTKYNPARKYGAPIVGKTKPRSRSIGRSRASHVVRGRKRSASASPTLGRRHRSPGVRGDGDILPMLLEEFPFLHLTTETLHELWRKSSKQIEQLSKAEQEVKSKKTRAQVQIEEADRRQKVLMEIMKKELAHNKRMKEIKERQQQQQIVRTSLREKRQQSARARKYYDEYHVRARSKMLKKKTKEELIFKHLFNEGLEIQRDRIRELRKYAKEQRSERNKRQQEELEALENYYRDQFSMLADSMAKEKSDLEIREKSQSKVLEQMKKELRRKMETEIKSFQEQMYRDEDDEYFRQLDADKMRYQLQMARYQARI